MSGYATGPSGTSVEDVSVQDSTLRQCAHCGMPAWLHGCDRADVALLLNYVSLSWLPPDLHDAFDRLDAAVSA